MVLSPRNSLSSQATRYGWIGTLLDLNSGMSFSVAAASAALSFLQPLLARLALVALDAARGRLQHRAQDGARVADQPQADVAVLADRAVVHVDLHQLQILADALAVAHAEIERRADDDDARRRSANACVRVRSK